MDQFLKIALPIYFILFFGIAFVAKSIIVAKRIGKNPFVLPNDGSAYGLIGFYFKLTLIALFVYVITFSIIPHSYHWFLPIKILENVALQYVGIGLLATSLIWTIIAQIHMKDSWRIGIDEETQTELITAGLFSLSRNPVFFGMTLSLMGLFFATPNVLTGLFLILGHILMQIQIRLEEEFLVEQHGEKYLKYRKKVRRMI